MAAPSKLCVVKCYGIVALRMAVFIFVCHADRPGLSFEKDNGRIHLTGAETDIHLLTYELGRDIEGNLVNRYGSIFPDLPGNAVQETFIQPFR